MFKRLIPVVLASLLVGLATATPARAAEVLTADQMPQGRAFFSLGGQLSSTHGLLSSFHTGMSAGGFEFGASLIAPPANLLSFFTADGHMAFVGQTGSFLPINLMPVMGFGMAAMFRDLPTNKLDMLMWMYMPIGLRYVFNAGGLTLGAEALYHLPALYMIKGETDPARWHFELTARTGRILVGGFYDMGPVYNGPGARVGLVF